MLYFFHNNVPQFPEHLTHILVWPQPIVCAHTVMSKCLFRPPYGPSSVPTHLIKLVSTPCAQISHSWLHTMFVACIPCSSVLWSHCRSVHVGGKSTFSLLFSDTGSTQFLSYFRARAGPYLLTRILYDVNKCVDA